MSLLARMVRQGSLQLHAYKILTNHFHLLLRSVEGQFSEAVGWIERRYVRYFNRSRNRDGPLFCGRFTSREASSAGYWETLIRYIDQNAVIAGIVARSSDYPHCSAFRYSKANGPVWLERTLVERTVKERLALERYDPCRYAEVFGPRDDSEGVWVIERSIHPGSANQDPLVHLFDAASAGLQRWFTRRARLADGAARRQAILPPGAVWDWILDRKTAYPSWPLGRGTRPKSGWRVLTAGLFRDACGLTIQEIAVRSKTSLATTNRDLRDHGILIEKDGRYAKTAIACVSDLASAAYPGLGQPHPWQASGKNFPGTDRLTPTRTGAWHRPRRG